MTNQTYILAHDLGTTGNKATLFDADGNVVAAALHRYETDYARPAWAEQDAADWRDAVFESTRRLLSEADVNAGDVAAVSFSGHMQGVLLVDADGVPLRPAIIWADQRATAQADAIERICGRDAVHRLTGHRISPAYPTAKLLWIKEQQPDLYARAHRLLQVKDYAAFLLTGVYATDFSDASSTQAFDLVERRWSADLLKTIGVRSDLFPDAHPSATVIGRVTKEAAQATGLRTGTPVVIGGGDGACATVGAGSVREGDAYTYVGSSAWIALTTDRPIFDPQQRTFTFAHMDPNLYFPLGTMQTAGGAFDWLEGLLRGEESDTPLHDGLERVAASIAPGAGGLIFLPYLMGERSPHWNPHARAALVGAAMSHQRPQMARAVLEGVALNLGIILAILREQDVAVDAMRLIGGGARSATWRQILADVFELPLLLPQLTAEATALGAAIAGGVGVGLFPDYNVAHHLIRATQAEQPNPQHFATYRRLADLFRRTYAALEPIYAELATLETPS